MLALLEGSSAKLVRLSGDIVFCYDWEVFWWRQEMRDFVVGGVYIVGA